MKNICQPPMIHHCNQTEYIQRGASLVQMAADDYAHDEADCGTSR